MQEFSEDLNKYAQALGSLGGKKRKENSTLEQRRAWGKLGGRPKKLTKDNNHESTK